MSLALFPAFGGMRRARICMQRNGGRLQAPVLLGLSLHALGGAQLYAGGELVGGCDIVEEMARAGVLQEELSKMAART